MPLWELPRPTAHRSTPGLLPACRSAAALPRRHGAAMLAAARPAAGTGLSALKEVAAARAISNIAAPGSKALPLTLQNDDTANVQKCKTRIRLNRPMMIKCSKFFGHAAQMQLVLSKTWT